MKERETFGNMFTKRQKETDTERYKRKRKKKRQRKIDRRLLSFLCTGILLVTRITHAWVILTQWQYIVCL